MKSQIENVNCLVSLLKQYDIKHAVLAPGASDIPVIHVIEEDPYFSCYSVVDERSVVYFAMGLAQQIGEPVMCVCTSGTAVSNFLPGITEAFYQNVPILAITSDKNQNFQGQIETQKIEQIGIFGEHCKKCVNLPVIRDNEDRWLCERLVNEALIALTHHGTGPVQINIPVIGDIGSFAEEPLPLCKRIHFFEGVKSDGSIAYLKRLKDFKKIMVIVGQNASIDAYGKELIEKFYSNFNAVIAVDHLSNLQCLGVVHTYPVTEMEKQIAPELIPDLVISVGNNIASYDLKYILREKNIEHWQIDEMGRIRDVFHHLTAVFECTIADFFENVPEGNGENNHSFYARWMEECNKIKISDLPYSSFYIAQELSKTIPENSILHLAILNSTRLMQYFNLRKNVVTYSNFGALGIDGCLSSFMGQAVGTDKLAFCLIGDLSFFYDMNAAGITCRKNNVRIVLLNNTGAGEFYFTLGKEKIPSIDRHIAARNSRIAKGWIESLGYDYYPVTDSDDVKKVFPLLEKPSDKPIFVEVFLDIEKDTDTTKEYYKKYISYKNSGVKKAIKGVLSDSQYEKLKNIYHKIKQ